MRDRWAARGSQFECAATEYSGWRQLSGLDARVSRLRKAELRVVFDRVNHESSRSLAAPATTPSSRSLARAMARPNSALFFAQSSGAHLRYKRSECGLGCLVESTSEPIKLADRAPPRSTRLVIAK